MKSALGKIFILVLVFASVILIGRCEVSSTNFGGETNSYEVSLSALEGGTVTGGGTYKFREMATLRAIPDEGYIFKHWLKVEEVVSTDAIYNYRVEGNLTLVAVFETESLIYSINVQEPVGGTVIVSQEFANLGEIVELMAQPDEGYVFIRWVINGENYSDSNIMVTENLNIQAIFLLVDDAFIITIASSSNAGIADVGNVEVTKTIAQEGEEITFIASAKTSDYLFTHWIVNGETIPYSTFTMPITEDTHAVAYFDYDGMGPEPIGTP